MATSNRRLGTSLGGTDRECPHGLTSLGACVPLLPSACCWQTVLKHSLPLGTGYFIVASCQTTHPDVKVTNTQKEGEGFVKFSAHV